MNRRSFVSLLSGVPLVGKAVDASAPATVSAARAALSLPPFEDETSVLLPSVCSLSAVSLNGQVYELEGGGRMRSGETYVVAIDPVTKTAHLKTVGDE